MSKVKHTPGKWRIKDCGSHFQIHCEDFPIAEVYGRSAYGTERCQANAELMSAAPDLKQALHDILYSDWDNRIPDKLFKAAKAALDKSEGMP